MTSRRSSSDPGIRRLDLARPPDKWDALGEPDIAFLCAGITKLSACEADPAGSSLINVGHMSILAERLTAGGCRVLYPSTNLVLGGEAPFLPFDAPYRPVSEYGRQKALTEQRLLGLGERAVILRMTKIMPPRLPLFRQWVEALRAGRTVQPLSDLMMSPIALSDLVDTMITVAMQGGGGIYQVSGDRDISYAEAAMLLADRLGCPRRLVQPKTMAELGVAAAAMRYTTLDITRVAEEFSLGLFDVAATVNGIDLDEQ
jgi:dTDP-4-dehydrorhamnose reductase